MQAVARILRLIVLGEVDRSESAEVSLNGIVGAVRPIAVAYAWAAISGPEWQSPDGCGSLLIVTIFEFLRRFLKDYSR